jgi:hypothetical protein
MRNLFDKIRKTLIKWLGGYTEQTIEVVETKTVRLSDKDIITLECSPLFEARRFKDSESYQRFAKEAAIQSLSAELMEYMRTSAKFTTEYVPELDSIRLKAHIEMVNSDW